MNWVTDRDTLIAQTLEFVQSVGRQEQASNAYGVAAAAARPKLLTPIEARRREPVEHIEAPVDTPAAPAPRTMGPTAEQNEIRARIASFRAHQERFNRERAEHVRATLSRLRDAMADLPSPPRSPS